LRITATGDVITCLYGKPVINLREYMRNNNAEANIKEAIVTAVGSRARTGFEAQQRHAGVFDNSMTSIGG
jgi:cyclic pyranopterin phosphate synthase